MFIDTKCITGQYHDKYVCLLVLVKLKVQVELDLQATLNCYVIMEVRLNYNNLSFKARNISEPVS